MRGGEHRGGGVPKEGVEMLDSERRRNRRQSGGRIPPTA